MSLTAESYQLGELEKKVAKHQKDLYEGNGKPALTVRMAVMEDCVAKIERNLSKLTWIAVSCGCSAIGALLADVLVRVYHK